VPTLGPDPAFERGRSAFFQQRERKHPQTAPRAVEPESPKPPVGSVVREPRIDRRIVLAAAGIAIALIGTIAYLVMGG
jgi:hypothetical protein